MRRVTDALALTLLVTLAACGDADDAPPQAQGDPCVDGHPWDSAACAHHIAETCGALTDERACLDQAQWFSESASPVRCGWGRVTSFADAEGCVVDRQESRCFGFFVSERREECVDVCPAQAPSEDDLVLIERSFVTFDGTSLVQLPCFGASLLDGPIHEELATKDPEQSRVRGCASNLLPERLPLCECIPATCGGAP